MEPAIEEEKVEEIEEEKVEKEAPEEEEKEKEEEEEKPDEKVEPKKEVSEEELQLLRQITRDQKKELTELKGAIDKQQKLLKDKGLITEEDEQVLAEEKAIADSRSSQLEMLAEVMRVNPKFEDLDAVVSQEHFDDYIEAVAKTYVEKNGGKFAEVSKQVEARIWSMPNPYKFLYNEIKKYHPAYVKAEKKEELKIPEKKIASSIADLPGGGQGDKGGWTAKRIDDLPENELDKVPQDVYQKYLRNELK
jgi:hypothetical protein